METIKFYILKLTTMKNFYLLCITGLFLFSSCDDKKYTYFLESDLEQLALENKQASVQAKPEMLARFLPAMMLQSVSGNMHGSVIHGCLEDNDLGDCTGSNNLTSVVVPPGGKCGHGGNCKLNLDFLGWAIDPVFEDVKITIFDAHGAVLNQSTSLVTLENEGIKFLNTDTKKQGIVHSIEVEKRNKKGIVTEYDVTFNENGSVKEAYHKERSTVR